MCPRAKLVAVGAFDPPTFAHLRMFERAKEYLETEKGIEIVEGIVSIIPDTFRSRNCLATHGQRMTMLKRILRKNRWIRADDWQCTQSPQLCLPEILDYIDNTYNVDHEGMRIATIFLCSDQFFEHVAVDDSDFCTTLELSSVLSNFDVVVVCPGSSLGFGANDHSTARATTSINLTEKKTRLHIVHDDVFCGSYSGKKVREALKRGESISYCTDNLVISFIYEQGLYCRQKPPVPVRKKVDRNPWELASRQPDVMSCSLPPSLLSEYLKTDPPDIEPCSSQHNIPSITTSNDTACSKPPQMIHFTLPLKSTTHTHGHHLSDPSLLLSCKDSVPLSARSVSTVSFTFQQYNLSFTPESTV